MEILPVNRQKWRVVSAYLLGVFSTMPIVGITVLDKDISFYRLLYFLVIGICLIDIIHQGKITVYSKQKKLLTWLGFSIISCLVGWITIPALYSEWANEAFSALPKVLILIIFALLWSSDCKWTKYNEYVIKGLFVGCVCNCIWAIIDAAGYYLFGKSINNIVFAGYIDRNNIRYGTLSLISAGMIRSGGFNSDPAQLGFVAPILAGVALKRKKPLLFILSLGGTLASASTTALVSTLIIIIVCLKRKSVSTKIRIRKLIGICLVVFFCLIMLFILKDQISTVFNKTYYKFFDRVSSTYISNESRGGNIRIQYLQSFPDAVLHVLPWIVTGTGFGTASLGYARSAFAIGLMGERVKSVHDMENTYIAYFLDTGLIGFVLLASMLIVLLKWSWIRSREASGDLVGQILFSAVLSTVLSFAFYHYILFGAQMLLFTIALSIMDEENRMLV